MTVFKKYAEFYNLFYRDKDYVGEARYVHELLQKYAPGAKKVLDLGCGTGTHAEQLAVLGYHVLGVDRSPTMLKKAQDRLTKMGGEHSRLISFIPGDIRSLRTGQQYDAVVSLFHVMSYQSTDMDLQKSFETAKTHLTPGGIFLFDCWHGPAVQIDPPVRREHRYESGDMIVIRVAEPASANLKNTVDIHYHVTVMNRAGETMNESEETHRMRYLFQTEIEGFAHRSGFKTIVSHAWMTHCPLALDNWSACFVVGT